MHLQFIEKEFSELTPEAKYFCAMFLKNFGVDGISPLSVNEFASKFGMTTYLVTESIKSLDNHEFICLHATPQRQARRYKATLKLKELLEQSRAECQYKHRELIDRILSNTPLKSEDANKGNLKIQSRLLLVVLLLFADEFGVTETLGRSRLRKLTGLNDQRLQSHTAKLIERGLISNYVSGMSCKLVFGKRTGIYFLSLGLFPDSASIKIAILPPMLTQYIIQRIYIDLHWWPKKHPYTYKLKHVDILNKFFPKKPTPEFLRFLELKINSYVSILISKHWNDLVENASDISIDKEIISRIKQDIAPKTLPVIPGKAISSDDYDVLTEFIYEESLKLALHIPKGTFENYDNMMHLIYPSSNIQGSDGNYIASIPKDDTLRLNHLT